MEECYSVLGCVHSVWHPLPGRFKDYIATPKANGYQSLHTTVVGPDARPIEVQIRTAQMHEHAEYGVAAHWLYKKTHNSQGKMSADDRSIDSTINHIRRSLDWVGDDEIQDPHEFLQNLRVDLFEGEIFVFTPKGEVMSLRRESTPLDFAYAVHTEVGNHCVGAKVNGSVVPLTYHLQMGDRVEILTNKNGRPSRDWMGIVVTPSARSKVRKYFASATKATDAEQGRAELARELRRRGYGISTVRTTRAIEEVLPIFDAKNAEALFQSIYLGTHSAKQVANRVQAVLEAPSQQELAERARKEAQRQAEELERGQRLRVPHTRSQSRQKKGRPSCGVVVKGDPDLLVHLAGFITRGRGVSVHRVSCPNVAALMQHPERMIDVEWDASGASEFQVEIVIEASDRMGLLKDVTIAITDAGANILSASTQVSREGVARLRFLVAISEAGLLDTLLSAVSRVPSVFEARRLMPGEGAVQMKRRI